MEFTRCDNTYFQETKDMYHRIVQTLRATVNYPKWGVHHPSDDDLKSALDNGELYICLDGGKVVGAVVLNEDPVGNYDVGDWQRDLTVGEYLVIHLLTSDPEYRGKGIGAFLIDNCVELARQGGYKAVRLDVVPGNDYAIRIYLNKGFTYAGTKDTGLGVKAIPLFELYEKNL